MADFTVEMEHSVALAMTEHLAISLAECLPVGAAKASLPITEYSGPVIVAALKHYAKCLRATPPWTVSPVPPTPSDTEEA